MTFMRIHARNVGILIFGCIIVFLLLRHGRAVSEVFGNIECLGPGHGTDEKTSGLLALGFICVSLVAIVRLLAQNGHSGRRDRRDDPED